MIIIYKRFYDFNNPNKLLLETPIKILNIIDNNIFTYHLTNGGILILKPKKYIKILFNNIEYNYETEKDAFLFHNIIKPLLILDNL